MKTRCNFSTGPRNGLLISIIKLFDYKEKPAILSSRLGSHNSPLACSMGSDKNSYYWYWSLQSPFSPSLPSPALAPMRGLSDLTAGTCTQTELVSALTDDSCGRAWSLSALCLLLSQQETLGSLFGRCSELRDPGLLPFPEGHLPPPPPHRAVCVQTLPLWIGFPLVQQERRRGPAERQVSL